MYNIYIWTRFTLKVKRFYWKQILVQGLQMSEFDDDETDTLVKLVSFYSNLNFLNSPT